MNTNFQISRRGLLATGAVVATATALSAKSYARVLGANERINIGFIGAGGQGMQHINACRRLKDSQNLDFGGVADCWQSRAEEGAAILETQSLAEYRKLLDNNAIDYVTIATPEHRHVQIVLDALDAGKAVYCEKPLTHTIEEAQLIARKQKETELPLQVGVQSLSDDCYASAAKAIADGVIGKVVQAQIEYVRRYDKQGPFRLGIDSSMPKPPDLNWSDWLGETPKIPWNPHHYFEWRCYSAYAGSIGTDLFVHRISRIIKVCELTYPRRVVGMGGIWQWNDGRDFPDNFEMICEYPRGMTVYVLGTMSNRVGVDHLIRGYRGTLYFTPEGWVAKDKDGKELASDKNAPPKEDIHLHHINLHRHLRNGVPLNGSVELGVYGVVATCMANESWRTNMMMGWDEKNERMAPAHTLNPSHLPESPGSRDKQN